MSGPIEISIFQNCKEKILQEPFHRFTATEVFLQVTDAFHDVLFPVLSIDPNSKWGPVVNRSVSGLIYMVALPYFSYFAFVGALFQGSAAIYRWRWIDTSALDQTKLKEHNALKNMHTTLFIQEAALFALSLIKAHYLINGIIGVIGSKLFLDGIQNWEKYLERKFDMPQTDDPSVWRKSLRDAIPELACQILQDKAPAEEAPSKSSLKTVVLGYINWFFPRKT